MEPDPRGKDRAPAGAGDKAAAVAGEAEASAKEQAVIVYVLSVVRKKPIKAEFHAMSRNAQSAVNPW